MSRTRPSIDPRRQWCEKLVRELGEDSGRRAVELTRLMRGGLPPAFRKPAIDETTPAPIQIWRPVEMGGERYFVRPEPGPWFDHYAQRLSIPARKPDGLRRICLFGESAAAGYLYAPHVTPALVLEHQLRAVTGEDSCEVIDLARTNETLDNLVQTVAAARQLEPDLLVLFAGNNWNLLETPACSPLYPDANGRLDVARALRRGGLDEVVEWAARRTLDHCAAALEAIASLAGDIPLLVLVPEINLADWHPRQPVQCLPGDGLARWWSHWHRGRRHLESGQAQAALDEARRMLHLDGWSSPSSYRLMADAYRALGALEDARDAAQAAVDNDFYATQALLGSPQATSMVKELLRQFALRHGLMLVDLPAVFPQHKDGQLPGRAWFLDYCHLTLEGMRVAMGAVTDEILKLSGLTGEITEAHGLPSVTPSVQAHAAIGAALHTAHRMAPSPALDELIEFWLARAFECDSTSTTIALQGLMALRSTQLSESLTGAEQGNQAGAVKLTPQHGWRYRQADSEMIRIVDRVLKQRAAEAPIVNAIRDKDSPIDLLDERYDASPLFRSFEELMPEDSRQRRAYRRYLWPESRFLMPVDQHRGLDLRLVVRAPELGPSETGELRVEVNGQLCATTDLQSTWSRIGITIPAAVLLSSGNQLILHWPIPEIDAEARHEQVTQRLERGRAAVVHPVYGEIASLLAIR